MPADEAFRRQHLLKLCVELSSSAFDIYDVVNLLRTKKLLSQQTEGLNCCDDDFALFVVQQLYQLRVQVLEGLLCTQILGYERQLTADLLPYLPVKVLADVCHEG